MNKKKKDYNYHINYMIVIIPFFLIHYKDLQF